MADKDSIDKPYFAPLDVQGRLRLRALLPRPRYADIRASAYNAAALTCALDAVGF